MARRIEDVEREAQLDAEAARHGISPEQARRVLALAERVKARPDESVPHEDVKRWFRRTLAELASE